MINFAIKKGFSILADNFEKPLYEDKKRKQIVLKIFISMFFNTVILILISNAKQNFTSFELINGKYNDISPGKNNLIFYNKKN